ncbi:hypothetical protein J2855_001713 [Agrobacterium tumefaciens]|uniref:hypothetical protein n=1 Tax=Agrobacterium tumefaciens TaxID=358 RepID=UPI00101A572D|nr:hypothetical protein [Agrobacterium tumefaciens]MBP2508078.1 hypothetical protein [Agrobacterium tumefaciens]MBP2517230.1 hypothetical protein [Agrobacterium tumefaciens]MBP2575864.1 hypothetical protein [Agrobacterium tumefaciens]MBP2594220.1 hypothetical protein [Agrobacterium tumefaciens]
MRDDEKYQRRHLWMRTWKGERGLNGELLNDFVCIVEGEIVGRISEQETGPMRGTYKWDGGHSRRIRVNVLPQGGYASDVHEAARKVEDHYDLLRQEAGLPPVVGIRVKT